MAQEMTKIKYAFLQFIRKHSFWLWGTLLSVGYCISLIFYSDYTQVNYGNLFTVTMTIMGFNLTILTFIGTNKNIDLGNYLKVFYRNIFLSFIMSVILILFYLFYQEIHVGITCFIFICTNLFISLLYVIFIIKNTKSNKNAPTKTSNF